MTHRPIHNIRQYLQVEINRQGVGPHQPLHQILLPIWDVLLQIYIHANRQTRKIFVVYSPVIFQITCYTNILVVVCIL